MVNKQFDVNIGIGVAVEGIDQKSLENAKQKIKKALNNTDAQVKLDIDSESMKEFNATIIALKKNIATLSFRDANSNLKEFVVNLKTGSVQAYDSAREAAAKYADRLIKLQSQLSKFKTVSPVDDKATKNIKQTQKAIEDLKKSMKANLPDDLFRSVLDTFDKTVLSIDEVKTRTGEASKRFITLSNDGQNVVRVIQQWNSNIGQFVTKTVETTSEFKTVQAQADSLAQKIKSMMTLNSTDAGFVTQMQGYLDKLKQVNVYSTEATQKIQDIANAVQSTSDKYRAAEQTLNQYTRVVNEYFKTLTSLEKLESKEKYGGGLTEAESEYKEELQKTVGLLKQKLDVLQQILEKTGKGAEATQIYANAEKKANVETSNFQDGLIKSNSLLDRFASGISDYFNRFVSYTLVTEAFNALRDAMRSAIEVAEDMNAVFTDIQMVSLSSAESIDKLKESYAELAYEYSSSVVSVAEGANQWIRQGKSSAETTELLQASMVLSRVGAIDAADATEYLTSTLNGYQLEADQAMRVVDAMSQADIESASSVEDLAIALQKTANIARNAGVDFETLVGWIAEVKEVTQRSAATIGESFKTILSRLGSVKAGTFLSTDLEAEYQDLDSFINDTEKVLSKVGISLRDTNKDFRDAEDVINDVAASWQNYSDLEKNAIATAIAGTRQRENFTVLNLGTHNSDIVSGRI